MAKVTALLSEFLGTFMLILSILITNGNIVFVGVTFAGLLALTGKVSGGHLNPAVSIAMYWKKKYSINDILLYIVSQIAGGIASVYVFNLV